MGYKPGGGRAGILKKGIGCPLPTLSPVSRHSRARVWGQGQRPPGRDRALLCPRRELAPVLREPQALHHAVAPLPARAALMEKGQVRRLQRARQRAERQALSAKGLQRQNRARESRPRRPKHQGSFIYQPCQRQFNY